MPAKPIAPVLTLRDSEHDARDYIWESFLSENGGAQGQVSLSNYTFNAGKCDEATRDKKNEHPS
jgi:hypothetical protein